MRATVLISSEPAWALSLARAWAEGGDTVTAVLLDGAAAAARPGHADAGALAGVQDAGVRVLAHDDALRRRAMERGALAKGVRTVDLDHIAELVTDGSDKAVWL